VANVKREKTFAACADSERLYYRVSVLPQRDVPVIADGSPLLCALTTWLNVEIRLTGSSFRANERP
jgi:hypothetical protein